MATDYEKDELTAHIETHPTGCMSGRIGNWRHVRGVRGARKKVSGEELRGPDMCTEWMRYVMFHELIAICHFVSENGLSDLIRALKRIFTSECE